MRQGSRRPAGDPDNARKRDTFMTEKWHFDADPFRDQVIIMFLSDILKYYTGNSPWSLWDPISSQDDLADIQKISIDFGLLFYFSHSVPEDPTIDYYLVKKDLRDQEPFGIFSIRNPRSRRQAHCYGLYAIFQWIRDNALPPDIVRWPPAPELKHLL